MEGLILELNNFLADLNVLYRKLQNYHWNIKGKDFFVLHTKLEEYYDGVNEQIDEIAEHILTLNGQPMGTMKDYLEMTTLAEAKNEKVGCEVVITNVIADFTKLLKMVTDLKKKAEALEEYATSSLMDNYILDYSKKLWMLNSNDSIKVKNI